MSMVLFLKKSAQWVSVLFVAILLVVTGCTDQTVAVATQESDEGEDDSDTSTDETFFPFYSEDTSGGIEIASGDFDLLTLVSGNTSEGDGSGSVRVMQLTWNTADAEANSISYTICEANESAIDRCNVLGVELDVLSFTVQLDSLLDATNQSYFVIAETDTATLTSSEKRIAPGELGRMAGYFKASNAGTSDDFGYNVAISSDGKTLVTATPWDDSGSVSINGDQEDDSSSAASGAIYVFRYDDSSATWSQTDYIKASNAERADYLGYSLALSADGNTIVVGAYGEDSGSAADETDNSASYAGAVYVFGYNGSYWSQTAYLKEVNPEAGDEFGYSVSLNSAGDRLAIGANEEDSASGVANAGAAFIFDKDSSGTWAQTAELTASNADADDRFGRGIHLSGDGTTLAVSTILESSSETGTNGTGTNNDAEDSGAVYIFTYQVSTDSWNQTAYIKASNTSEEDYFGRSIVLNDNGTLLAVGATYEDSNAIGINGDETNNDGQGAGAVYVFVLSGDDWSQTAYIKGDNTEGADGSNIPELARDETDEYWGDHFGGALAFNSDGTVLVVAASGEDSAAIGIDSDADDDSVEGAGAVYVFTYDDVTQSWQQTNYVKASNTQEGDAFGNSIALTPDGQALVVGAKAESSGSTGVNTEDTGFDDDDENDLTSAGAFYLY